MPNLLTCRSEILEYFRLPEMDRDSLVHGIFSRRGGESPAPYDSLNISFGVGDDPRLVRRNRSRLKDALGLKTLVSARQVHGSKVLLVDPGITEDDEVEGYDALVTSGGVGLMIQQADCQAVILHDPGTPALAVAHAGWRGSVAGIIGATIRTMTAAFGSNASSLRAGISPSLGACCAEFVHFHKELPLWMHQYQVRPNYFDFPAITSHQLQEAGVPRENIFVAGVCTRCDSAYFSYRRSAVTGRCATVAALSGR